MAHPDVPAEQQHVDLAYERLEAMRAAASGMLADAFGERGSTFQSFTERDIRVRTSLNRLEQLQIGRETLVFGRVDQASGEAYHIGRLAISDVDQEPLVVDWRAPVAESFYRATGAHAMGLHRRRHFLAEGQRVLDLEDELFDGGGVDADLGLGLSGSQVLLAALRRSRTGRMRDIVATVQREQDEIIRGPLSELLVVQGGPGTGKTAVALHRAAYLLYTHRFPLESQGVLVVGPNPTFLRYIEHVLPSLGESGVELSTVAGLFAETRPTATEGEALARLKGDPRLARVLARAVVDRQRPLRREVLIPYGRANLRLSPEASAQIVSAAKRRPGTHNARRRTVETLLWRALHEEVERRFTPSLGEASLPTVRELGAALRHSPEVTEALDRMWPVLTPQAFLHDLFGAKPLIDLAARDILTAGERELLYRPRCQQLSDVAWTDADIPLLDEARAQLGAPRRRSNPEDADEPRTYGHIVVDEAQDLSPMELRMLARRSLSGSMTVVGDIAQATGGWAPADWAQVVGYLPARRGWRQVELTVNYRTPGEIMELAGLVLAVAAPGMRRPESVRESGLPPRFVSLADHPSLSLPELAVDTVVSELGSLDADEGTVGLIVAPSAVAPVAEALADAGLVFGTVGDAALDSAITLLALEDAKGLEFDAVVVVEPGQLIADSSQGRRALYVALTRATQRLAVVYDQALPAELQPAASGEAPGLRAGVSGSGLSTGAAGLGAGGPGLTSGAVDLATGPAGGGH